MYQTQKNITIIFLVIFSISQKIYSQENIDSVNYYLSKIKNDKIILPIDSVSKYYQKAREFSDIHKKILLLRKEARYLTDKGMQNTSYQRLKQALTLAKENDLPVVEALINNGFSYYYYHFNKFSLSYEYLLLSKNQIEKLTENQIKNYNAQNKNRFTKQQILQTTLSNIGTIALINEEIEKAEKHFKEALAFSINNKDKNGELDAKINLASVLYNKKEHKEAIDAFNKLIDKYKLSESDLSLAYYNISLNYADLDSLSKASIYIDKAINISEKIGDRVMLIDLYFLKSEIENSLGNYNKERELLHKSLKDAINIEDTDGQIDFYQALANSEEVSGNYQKANEWYKKLNLLQDSLNEERTRDVFNKIEIENNLLVQEQKNELQAEVIHHEKARAKLYMIIMILFVALSIALFVTWLISKNNNNKRIKIEQQQAKIKDIEIQSRREIEAIETERIQEDLKAKKRELLVSLLFIKKRNEKLGKIHQKIDKLANQSIIRKENLMSLKNFVTKMSDELREEEDLQHKLVNTHKNFFNKLLAEYPELSKTELKILAYLRIGLSTKEIADVQYVSIDAIRKSRYRIRKKLNLDSKDSLEKFILQFY